MLKSVKKLVEAATIGHLDSLSLGNHSFSTRYNKWYFRYHGSAVCVVDPIDGTVLYDNCGYYTSSTTRTINSYREAFSNLREISRKEMF